MDKQTMLNKLTKYFWSECMVNGVIDLNLIDGSDDFSCIPVNSRGIVQLRVGDLRDIVKEVFETARNTSRVVGELPEGFEERFKDFCSKEGFVPIIHK